MLHQTLLLHTVNGGKTVLTSGTSVSSSSNNTSLSVSGQANGAAVVISWYAENTTNNLREPNTGTFLFLQQLMPLVALLVQQQ